MFVIRKVLMVDLIISFILITSAKRACWGWVYTSFRLKYVITILYLKYLSIVVRPVLAEHKIWQSERFSEWSLLSREWRHLMTEILLLAAPATGETSTACKECVGTRMSPSAVTVFCIGTCEVKVAFVMGWGFVYKLADDVLRSRQLTEFTTPYTRIYVFTGAK